MRRVQVQPEVVGQLRAVEDVVEQRRGSAGRTGRCGARSRSAYVDVGAEVEDEQRHRPVHALELLARRRRAAPRRRARVGVVQVGVRHDEVERRRRAVAGARRWRAAPALDRGSGAPASTSRSSPPSSREQLHQRARPARRCRRAGRTRPTCARGSGSACRSTTSRTDCRRRAASGTTAPRGRARRLTNFATVAYTERSARSVTSFGATFTMSEKRRNGVCASFA